MTSDVPPLQVDITHEPFLPWVTLEFSGQTEELEHREALDWFKARGARDMEAVNSAICQALNFGRARVLIAKPVSIAVTRDSFTPQI